MGLLRKPVLRGGPVAALGRLSTWPSTVSTTAASVVRPMPLERLEPTSATSPDQALACL